MLKKILPPIILVAVPLLVLSPLWWPAHAMAFDMADYFLPFRYFLGECLRNGIFPWWNPYAGLGTPFHADPQSGAFYPIAWIIGFVFGYDFKTINWEYLLHIVIAGWGMYRLIYSMTKSTTASLCMAMCYQLCGVFIGNAQHLTWIISAAWLPWVIFFWKKIFDNGNYKDAVALALCLMMMTTGGYPAFIIILVYGAITFSLIFMWKKFRAKEFQSLKKFLLFNVIVLMVYLVITAPYIVSFIQSLPYFDRATAIDPAHANVLSFTPQSAISFLFPSATLSEMAFYRSDGSMTNGYMGLITLVFILTLFLSKQRRETWLMFFIACLFLLISFGSKVLLWNFFFNYVPLINHIRFPAAFRLFAIMGFLIAAAKVMISEESYRRTVAAAVILLVIIVIAAVVSMIDNHGLTFPENFSVAGLQSFYVKGTVANNVKMQSLVQIPLVLLLIIAFAMRKRLTQRTFHAVLIFIIVVDMGFATRFNIPGTMVSEFSADSLNMKLRSQPKGFPVSLEKNLRDVRQGGNGAFAPSYYNNNLFTKQFSYASYTAFSLNNKDSLDRFHDKLVLLAHPLIFITDQLQAYPENFSDTSFHVEPGALLVSKNFITILPKQQKDSLLSTISIESFAPDKISCAVTTNHKAILTLLQSYYPGWKAWLDGKPATISISDYSTMSVVLPAGKHSITFAYDAPFVKAMLWLSVIVQICALTFLVIKSR